MAKYKRHSIETCQKLAESHGGKFLSDKYSGVHGKYLWQCEFGHQWETTLNTVKLNHWCPVCAIKVHKIKVNKAAKKRSRTLQDCLNLAESRGGKFLSNEYSGNKIKYLWECSKGHQWQACFNKIQQGRWCPSCKQGRIEETNLKRYGTKAPAGNAKVKEKAKQTCLERYGTEYASQSFQFKERRKQTNMERYGVPYSSQNREVALKTARSLNNSTILTHWKTGEELVCVASYEKAVVEYFNANHINFLWQPEVFTMPNGYTYRPDCYLPDEDLWVEIKGYMREKNELKWLWFQKEYPNSELWNEKKLKELAIL